jgi:predicted MFS family arabinose efflux permease
VFVFVLGAFGAPYFAARQVVLPEILGEDERVVSEANAFMQAATRVTLLLGPVLAGILIGILGASSVLLVDAATYAAAVLLIGAFVPAGRPIDRPDDARGLLVGLRFLVRDPLLRAWTGTIAIGDAAWNALFAALPFYAFTRYHGDAKLAGILLACFGVAAVVGNALSLRIRRRVDALRLIGRGVLFQAAPLWLLVAAGPAWIVALALLLSGLANGVVNPSLHALLTMRPPPAIRAQVLSAELTAVAFAGPAGFLVAGATLEHYGLTPIFVAVAAVQTLVMGARSIATLRFHEPVPAATAR